ncbi:MAG: helix-turn-helix domain-containing protein [Hyphomicrobiales bacterium]
MATPSKLMTTSEFAKAAGIPAATISKMIQEGKLKAKKEGNKWMILSSQLESKIVRELRKTRKSPKPKKPSKAAAAARPTKAPSARARVSSPPAPQVAASSGPVVASAFATPAPEPASHPEEKTYSIAEFATMTYLTEKGICEWLKIGRLQGVKTETGDWRVLESNLKVSDISRLVRR